MIDENNITKKYFSFVKEEKKTEKSEIEEVLKNNVNDAILKKINSLFNDKPLFPLDTFVVSIDIRNSTKLMSLACEAKRYVNFISTLTKEFKSLVITSNGIFDKFTGDGILCYFPILIEKEKEKEEIEVVSKKMLNFFSDCHKIFLKEYTNEQTIKYPPLFPIDFVDIGVGIGCDYGEVSFTILDSIFYAVGNPVVYACRISCAPAYNVYLNQHAYLYIQKHTNLFTKEVIHLKNNESVYVYSKEYRKNKNKFLS